MKKSLALLFLGLVLVLSGTLWLNRSEPLPPAAPTDFIEFTINIPQDIISLTHGFANGSARVPETITSLEGSSLGNMLAVSARVRDKDGNFVGMASQLELFPDVNGPRPGMSWKADWTITTPQGTLYIYHDERIAMEHMQAFAHVASGENWEGSIPANTSFGPHPSGRGIIVGGTGIYAGRTGTFTEKVDLQGLTTER
ncbi:MAG: hypothetical protein L3J04_06830, partial [Robiginitomaculum sp.]|nr:hypothetical protein [Robiginitomaculum sp.]